MGTRKGNTGRIAGMQPVFFPQFELLSQGSCGSSFIFTKHYTTFFINLSITHDYLFKFLVHKSKSGGIVEYSTELLELFKAWIETSREHYGTELGPYLNTSVQKSREAFEDLIAWSILLPLKEKQEFLINPCLVYHKDIPYTQWYEFCEEYILIAKKPAGPSLKQSLLKVLACLYQEKVLNSQKKTKKITANEAKFKQN